MVLRWNSEANREFARGKHKWSDIRAGIVWDVLKELNEAVRARGGEVLVADVPVTAEMSQVLRAILKAATKDGGSTRDAEELQAYLEGQRAAFIEILEKHPDGMYSPADEADAELFQSSNPQKPI